MGAGSGVELKKLKIAVPPPYFSYLTLNARLKFSFTE